ncbi:MAG: glycosyltransferase family 4 protein, partial [Chloroflexi bacterium]|nr:glycosyltransferase family 4 protein [Chloroflexota bacterium]
NMKVLMLLSNPFTNDSRVYNEAKALIQAGHEVTLIAWDREKQSPRRQRWDDIKVARVRTCLPAGCGLGYWPWHVLHLLLWQWRAYRQALASNNREGAFNVIHCHDFDTLPIGIRLKRKLGLPLVYDAHEIYGYMTAGFAPGWICRILLGIERRLVTKADRVIAVTEPEKRYFDGMTDKPVSVIMNCKPLQSLKYEPPDNKDKLTVLYIGLLDKTRTLSQLIHVMKQLPDVHCIIAGIGQPGYVQTLREVCIKSPNITFVGEVPMDKVIPMTKKADCSLLMLSPRHIHNKFVLGNKQFEAMVCGRPIICTKGTYSGELTEQEEVGLAVEYTEEALKQAIIKLRDAPELRERLGRNALKAAVGKYNWQREEKKLLKLYETIESEVD